MNCKNCNHNIADTNQFCPNCGAKVVLERITTKKLWKDFAVNFFGWDNKYLVTLKKLILKPEQVFNGYFNGVRKRYVNPFAFLAIGTALAVLVFSALSDSYIQMMSDVNEQYMSFFLEQMEKNGNVENIEEEKKEFLETNESTQKTILTYFSIFTFLLLPLYTLIAFWVFGKPHNYAEHLVINCYIHGVTFLITIICFLLGVFVTPHAFSLSLLAIIAYYLYVYARLNKYKLGTVIIKLFKFFAVLLGVFLGVILICVIWAIIIAIIIGFFKSKF